MFPPHFNGQQGSYEQCVEKWHQWLGGCDPAYRKANEARLIFSTFGWWLKGIITERTQHQRTAPTLKQLWFLLKHRFHQDDPSRADERWRALTSRMVKEQVSLPDLEDLCARWQRLLPLRSETRPHVIFEQLLSKVLW